MSYGHAANFTNLPLSAWAIHPDSRNLTRIPIAAGALSDGGIAELPLGMLAVLSDQA